MQQPFDLEQEIVSIQFLPFFSTPTVNSQIFQLPQEKGVVDKGQTNVVLRVLRSLS
jgi:hypothetical protein